MRLARITLFLVVTMVGAEYHASASSLELIDLTRRSRPSIFLLVVYDVDDKKIGAGTGFIVSSDGKLVTNYHVIQRGHRVIAKAENGALFPVVGILADDAANDVAILKVEGKNLPSLPIGSSERVEAGARIAVIGSPLELEGTVSEGIVSAVREYPGRGRWLQITAAISPGSSGSPVLNARGEVIGIATLLIAAGQSINFAVPIEVARNLLSSAEKDPQPKALTMQGAPGEDSIFTDSDTLAANAAEANGDYSRMLRHSQSLVKKFPHHHVAHYALGFAFLKLGFMNDALVALREAIRLKPDYAEAWLLFAAVCQLANRTMGCTPRITYKTP